MMDSNVNSFSVGRSSGEVRL
ncbi:Protein of unknown function [Pyronema omphalodes CBS 100304]|uniref:Uncharacterized protein n=1 Tax=Pyronema omphalodes (strain CBS 100304) TaxID=1076935 RepID=U4LRC7_PYROM|nr:Protein of unknown function [Pyronema omphalodes CBS 100304]